MSELDPPSYCKAMSVTVAQECVSTAFLRAITAQAGLVYTKPDYDDGIDALIGSHKSTKLVTIRNMLLAFQVKSTSDWTVEDGHVVYDLAVKNYNQLAAQSNLPQYLALYLIHKERDLWCKVGEEQVVLNRGALFINLEGFPRSDNLATVRIRIPTANRLTAQALLGLFMQASTSRRSA